MREFFEPTIIVRQDGFDLGLLEHELRNRNGIGIAGPSPRQVAVMDPVPIGQMVVKRGPDFGIDFGKRFGHRRVRG